MFFVCVDTSIIRFQMDTLRIKFSSVLTSLASQRRPSQAPVKVSAPGLTYELSVELDLLPGETKVFELAHVQYKCPVNGSIDGAVAISNFQIYFEPTKFVVRYKFFFFFQT